MYTPLDHSEHTKWAWKDCASTSQILTFSTHLLTGNIDAGEPNLGVQITDVKLSSDKPQPGEYLTVDVSGLVFENIMVSTAAPVPFSILDLRSLERPGVSD